MEEQNEHISASLTLESKVSLALLRPYGTEDETLRQADEGGLPSMIIHSTTRSRNVSISNNSRSLGRRDLRAAIVREA